SARRLERALEVVEQPAPPGRVVADGLLVPEAAVGEADGGDAVALLEVDLDQRAPRVAVPDPGEREAGRRLDLGVAAAAAVLGILVGIAHDDADGTADAKVDLRLARLPAVLCLPPAADHRLARPRVEHRV